MSDTLEILIITLVGFFIGGVGTGAGGLFILTAAKDALRILVGVLGFSAALMLGISFFDLIPHALGHANALWVIAGFLAGAVIMVTASRLSLLGAAGKQINPSRRMAAHMAFGIGMHNIPEGLAIGAALRSDPLVALPLCLAIFIHNLPEGMTLSVPARAGGLSRLKAVGLAVLAGLPLGIGAMLGAVLGGISDTAAAVSLSLAAGVMSAIVVIDVIPEILRRNKSRFPVLWFLAGLGVSILLVILFE